MQSLIHPSDSLSIELKNPEVDVTDDRSHKLILYTDGRKLQKSKDNNRQDVAARWDGSRLVSDEKSPLGGKMSRTFELSQDVGRYTKPYILIMVDLIRRWSSDTCTKSQVRACRPVGKTPIRIDQC